MKVISEDMEKESGISRSSGFVENNDQINKITDVNKNNLGLNFPFIVHSRNLLNFFYSI